MSDDYLWERTGEPDPEVERLEQLLGRHRYAGAPPVPRRRPWRRWLVVAAAVLVAGLALSVRGHEGPSRGDGHRPGDGPAWRYGTSAGTVAALGVGDWLETDGSTSARLDIADIGRLDVQPHSKVRLLRTGEDGHRLHLEHGSVHAFVDAPPRLFVIETPVANAVDLGCEYTLELDEAGRGRLAVDLGYVSLERAGREVKVPHGAVCLFDKQRGAGTPWFRDASDALREALASLDEDATQAAALGVALSAARKRDTLSLLSLLPRMAGEARGKIFDRMAALVAVPEGVTRDGVLALDDHALTAWWDALEWDAWY